MVHESLIIDDIFRRPISRHINTVVKVEQEDKEIVQQELEEYILTSSLEKNYSDILEEILETKTVETDEIGLWISGFFGSGKSHFMKILGYVLEDKKLPGGDQASEIFKQRTEDQILKASIESVNKKFDSEVLMFQIGSKENKSKTESITDIILREFNKMRGYAETPWVAEVEKNLKREGLYEDFKESIEEITGGRWEEKRTEGLFVTNNIKKALTKVNPDFETKEEAGEAIDNVKDNLIINSEKLAEEINQYLKDKEDESDRKKRFFVFLDEISQFIGDDEEKLLELQSISEDFGRVGKGKIWLGVTSQEKLKELVPGILAQQDQVSKVMDRFTTRVNLTPEEIDKVVKERVLKKSEDAYPKLSDFFEKYSGRLSTHYKLDSSRPMDAVDEDNFIRCYPFLPYELEILPDIFAGLRGKSGEDQLTGRERTMIDVVHSVFNEPTNFREKTLGNVVTLDLVFNEIREEIPEEDIGTIEGVSISDEDDEFAKKVLKVLYLLKQLDWIPNSPRNIAKGLYGKVGDTGGLDKKVNETLKKLKRANFVDKSEEGYRFLSQSEISLMEEIDGVTVRPADIKRRTRNILSDIFDDLKKFNYSNHASSIFDIAITADKQHLYKKGEIKIEMFSPIIQLTEDIDIRVIKTGSHNYKNIIYWISEEENGEELKDDIKRIFQIEQVLEDKLGENLSSEKQEALDKKRQDVERLKDDIRKLFKDSFKQGTIVYQGEDIELNESQSDLKKCIKNTLNKAIPRVYTQLEEGLANIHDDDLKKVFEGFKNSKPPKSFEKLNLYLNGSFNPNAPICKKIADEIKEKEREGIQMKGSEILDIFTSVPYGWDRNIIRIGLAVLFRNGKIIPNYRQRRFTDFSNHEAKNLFMSIRKFKTTVFEEQESVPPEMRRDARNLLHKLFDKRVKDTVSDVKNGIKDSVGSRIKLCDELLPELEKDGFPLKDEVNNLKMHLSSINEKKTQARVIKTFLDLRKELEELNKTVDQIEEFKEDGKLEKYSIYKEFLNEWRDFEDLASKSNEVKLDEKLVEVADRLENTLDSKKVIENWTDAQTDHNKIANEYKRQYEELYEKRRNVYEDAVEEIRKYGKELDDDKLKGILKDLKYRKGDKEIDIDISEGEHIGLEPSFERLDEHIRTVDSYISEAKKSIDSIMEEETDVNIVSVSISKIFSNKTIKSEEDLDDLLEEIRDEIKAKLDSNEKVEIKLK